MALKAVLIAPDGEALERCRQWIVSADKGVEVAAAADSLSKGREWIYRCIPDVVLVDHEQALDFVESVHLALRWIVISSDTSFSSALRAIRLGVFDYLPKPVDEALLTGALERLIVRSGMQPPYSMALRQAQRVRRKAQLLSMLTNIGQYQDQPDEELEDETLPFNAFYMMVIQSRNGQQASKEILALADEAVQRMRVNAETLLLYDSVVLFVMPQGEGEDYQQQARQIADEIGRQAPDSLRIGVSRLCSSKNNVRASYQQARRALWDISLMDAPLTIQFYAKSPGAKRVTDVYKQMEALIEKAELTQESANAAADAILKMSGQQYSNLRALVSLYAMSLQKKFGCPENDAASQALYETWFVGSVEDVHTCLVNICESLKASLEVKRGKSSLLARDALAYIQLHAMENISLESMAARFYVSPNYISALLRQETGIPFRQHVRKRRMEMAKTMLADPRLSVAEIAQAVGYSQYTTFYNLFREMEGISPTDYRKRLL